MAIIVDNETRLVVQGLTGSEGRFHGVRNRDYGTKVVAGVTPGKGGQDVEGIPVFNTVAEAVAETGANTSMIFVPARFASDAIYEAVDAGIETVVCITERLPAHEMLRVYTYIRPKGITMIGPNCPGVLSPGKANVGIIPAEIFREGAVGLVSRSGTLTYQIGHELTQLGLGNSTIVGIGGDPVVGSSFIDVLERFEADPETELVVMVGEIGGDEEEKAAPVHPGADDEARARLHRRLLRAARQDDGPRGRDHLRLVRDGAGEEGGARGVRGARSGRRRPRSRRWWPTGSDGERRFRALHAREQLFVMPNPWDVGSARLLASLGFEALATTSAGFAWSLGKLDQQRDARRARRARGEPRRGHGRCRSTSTASAATRTTRAASPRRCALLAEAGAAGFSVEDCDPATGAHRPDRGRGRAGRRGRGCRPRLPADGAHRPGREPHPRRRRPRRHDRPPARLPRRRRRRRLRAGALRPSLRSAAVVKAVGVPVNVLALPNGPSVAELASAGVRRVSTGGALARASYGALLAGARELLGEGTSRYLAGAISNDALKAAFE